MKFKEFLKEDAAGTGAAMTIDSATKDIWDVLKKFNVKNPRLEVDRDAYGGKPEISVVLGFEAIDNEDLVMALNKIGKTAADPWGKQKSIQITPCASYYKAR